MKKFLAQVVACLVLALAFSNTAIAQRIVNNLQDKAMMEAMDAWAKIAYTSYPIFGQSPMCGVLMKQMLMKLARIPEPIPQDFNEDMVLEPLKKEKCLDTHFYLRKFSGVSSGEPSYCKNPSIDMREEGALWVLKIRDFYGPDDEPECPERAKGFQKLVEEVQKKKIGADKTSTIILDLLDNGGSGPDPIVYVLDELFSPAIGTRMLTLNERVGHLPYYRTYVSKVVGTLSCPRVMLVNKKTASGGELFAAVMKQICPQMVTMGQLTFKKGVGSDYSRVGNFRIQFSTGEYLSGPQMVRVNDIGVAPDIVLPEGDEITAALAYVRNHPAP